MYDNIRLWKGGEKLVTAYELIDIIDLPTRKDVIVFINELIETIENDPRGFVNKLSNEIEELYDDLCPLCGCEKEIITHMEEREYQGGMVEEPIHRITCTDNNCPYVG